MLPILLSAALAVPPVADHPCELPSDDDPVQVYLVTVTPGWTAMSSLGHTLLLVAGGGRTEAMTYNWGAYDNASDTLTEDFVKGELPYFLATWSWPTQREVLLGQGRAAVAQRLDLDDVDGFVEQLEEAAKPENARYTYDWRTANCSTKARDFLDDRLGGALATQWAEAAGTTPREQIRRHLGRATAQDLGWSFVAGPEVDEPITEWERALFPDQLMASVADTEVDGTPLVSETCLLLPGRFGWAPERPPPTWPWMVPGGLFGWLAVSGAHGQNRTGRWLLGGSLLAYGGFLTLLGTLTLAIATATSMRAAGPTPAWLLASPHSAVFLAAAVPVLRGKAVPRWLLGAVGLSSLLAVVGLFVAPPGVGLALAPGILACAYGVVRVRDGAPQ
jgi:hypothetical protein